MKKIYFLSLLCCLSFVALSQTSTLTIYSTGAGGSYITGNATSGGARNDGNIVTTAATQRGYAVFNLSTVPAGATITAVTLGFYVTTYGGFGAPASGWNTRAFAGDLSTVTTGATLFTDMGSGTSLSTTSYGAASGVNTAIVLTEPAATTFFQPQIGNTISMCWTGGNTRTYTIAGETGNTTSTTTAGHAPYLSITYCVPPTGVTATANPAALCVGSTLTLTGTGTGATSFAWAGPGPFAAATETTTTAVTPASAGVYTLTATNTCGAVTATATATTASVSINTAPDPIAGSPNVCTGNTTLLTDATTGGTWSSSTTGVATVGTSSGSVGGVSVGSSTITYSLGTGCTTTTTVNDFDGPVAITGGAAIICVGSTLQLNETATGGVWSSSSTGVATVDATGFVTAVSGGSTNISYTQPSGCFAFVHIIVNPATVPPAISGSTTECQGSNTTLTDGSGGNWSSSNSGVALVYPTGVVYGISGGTATITFTSAATSCFVTSSMTVVATPAAIGGTMSACQGTTTALTETTTGGVWSSSNTGVATIDSTGLVSGVALGTTAISYTVPPGCGVAVIVTVHPTPAAIAGSAVVCTGSSTTLTDATSGGGTWSSSNTGIATVGITTGVVYGVTAGGANITFTTAAGCTITSVINDADPPLAITGDSVAICVGNSVTLGDASTGGTWTSGNTAVATVTAGGVVSGAGTGVASIIYTIANSCSASGPVSVNPLPVAIGGNAGVCTGATTALTETTTGGTWSSSDTTVATIDSVTGVVTGLLAGTSTITYMVATGCSITLTITDTDPPTPITGGAVAFCAGPGTTITLADGVTGGTWASSDTLIATVGTGTGIVTGVAGGVDTIIYTLATGCFATSPVTINPLPDTIAGGTSVCTGSTLQLADATTGGTWSSSAAGVATVDPASGLVTGVFAGADTIAYTIGTGCLVTLAITDNDPPGIIDTITTLICQGSFTPFTDASTGGTWSSSNTGVATVDVNGNVYGAGGGSATISYIMPTTCYVTMPINVNPLPAPILGNAFVCTGNTTLLTDATSGGVWATSVSTVASIDGSGTLYGIAGGTATISYTLPGTGCYDSLNVTDYDPPVAIGGVPVVCVNAVTVLTETTVGGSWSSFDNTIATVDPVSGAVTGVAAGFVTISYIMPSGCFNTIQVTVNGLPQPISGPTAICTGGSVLLSDPDAASGTWGTSASGIASIDGTGTVYGISAGTATISFTFTATGCFVTAPMTDNDPPGIIGGLSQVCVLATINLSDGGAGSWVSSDMGRATVDAVGNVTGVSAGTVTISFILPSGCFSTAPLTVNPLPAPIVGATAVCSGSTTTLTDDSTGGTWSSSVAAIASIDATSGLVSGLATGSTTISFTFTATGCYVTAPMQDNDPPTPINGTPQICVGSTVTFTEAIGGGIWSSALPGIADVDPVYGDVFGITPGADSISYTIVACPVVSYQITVNPAPIPIVGPDNVCVGDTIYLSDATTGGFWSVDYPGLAHIDTLGNVIGQSPGVVTVNYTTAGCAPATLSVTVNPEPTIISGFNNVCATFSTTLTDGVSGGIWTSHDPGIATIDPVLGNVVGIVEGATTITYMLPAGCFKTFAFTVNPLPGVITFPTAVVCQGSSILYSDDSTGGSWSSSNSLIATVNPGTGLITGVAAGSATIIYTLPTGCLQQAIVNVNPLPLPSTGPGLACVDATMTLINTSPGGPGSWSTGNSSIATVGLLSGVVTGVAVGTASIIYSLPTGCNTSTLVTVNPAPAAIFGLSEVCAGSSIILTDVSPGGTWTSTTTAATVVIGTGVVNGSSAGVTNIVYTLTATGCSVQTPVTVDPLPGPIAGASFICGGNSTILTDPDLGGTWSSTVSTVATIDSASGTVTGLATGFTNIIYTFPSGCSTGFGLTTEPTPVAAITPGGPTTFCSGGDVVLSATGGVYTYQWFDTGTAIGGAIGATYDALNTGSYTVVVSTTFGCNDTSAPVGVSSGIFPILDYTGSSSICLGNNLLLTVNTGGAIGSFTYTWSNLGTVIPGALSISYDANATGGYFSVVTVSGPSGLCTVNSDTVNIIVHPLPVPPVSFDGTTLSTSGGFTSYQWFLNTVGIPGANDSTYIPATNGSYRVLVVDANGCDGYSAAFNMASAGVGQIGKADVKIYPNPATSMVHIEAPESVRAVITGVEGKILINQADAKDVNISNLADGMYIIMIYDNNNNQIMTEKLIKE